MKPFTVCLVTLAALTHTLSAEEVLSTRPVVISPKRIETETTIPGKPAKRTVKTAPKEEPAAPEIEEKETGVTIDDKSVVMKISFKPGSIQLSKPIRKQLIALGLKPGQKIRITGFGESKGKKAARLANLRARVVASFLNEAVGEISTSLQWSAKPLSAYPEGAVIETVN
jgi:outer membrane protein OmpA-like peptidoglycan-associated protein